MLVEPPKPGQSGVEHGLLIFLGGPLKSLGYWTISKFIIIITIYLFLLWSTLSDAKLHKRTQIHSATATKKDVYKMLNYLNYYLICLNNAHNSDVMFSSKCQYDILLTYIITMPLLYMSFDNL